MLLVVIAFVSTGCGASPTSAKSVASGVSPYPPGITPGQAKAIVHRYMKKEGAAEAAWNTGVQATIEVPPQVLIDNMSWIAAKNTHEAPPKFPRQNLPATVWVPHGATFFAAFTNGIYMLFVKDPQGWMQAYSPGPYAHAPKPAVALDSHGYATALTTAHYGDLKWTPNQIADRYADDINSAAHEGTVLAAPVFASGPLTSAVFSDYTTFKTKPPKSASFSLTATADPVNVRAIALKDGGALAFITVSTQFKEAASPGDVFRIQPNGTELSGIVPAGQYTYLAIQTLQDMAVLIPPKGSTARVEVIADSVGGVHYTYTNHPR